MDKTDTERYIQRGFNMVNFHHQFHHHHDRMEQIEKNIITGMRIFGIFGSGCENEYWREIFGV
ncbi:hypothetical protein DERF_010341 [Dermatophagoides farinae]|uniref:Uncharacterized protein n=1 Tax=Dermatophagoides farinae TaxID=6954 RepID=A0A922HYS2_DERFA|nr:hypothetical protein DERF_010341 [Dermatophagoides farinae]